MRLAPQRPLDDLDLALHLEVTSPSGYISNTCAGADISVPTNSTGTASYSRSYKSVKRGRGRLVSLLG